VSVQHVPGGSLISYPKVVVFDADNTLYDWVGFYIPSFRAMVTEISRISGLDYLDIVASFRDVFRRHRLTDYAYALFELEILREYEIHWSPQTFLMKYGSALDAFRKSRKAHLRLYPGVQETLRTLKQQGTVLVAHSDSPARYVGGRLSDLRIDTYFDLLTAPKEMDLAMETVESVEGIKHRVDWLANEMSIKVQEFPSHQRKPDPQTLYPVFERLRVGPESSAYVGDSLSRDMLLASRTGIKGIWAKYGEVNQSPYYPDLLQISYWTASDVALEERLLSEIGSSRPHFIASTFSEVEILLRTGGE
jgi:FMN phosphatase YigB (HAD superfamily)